VKITSRRTGNGWRLSVSDNGVGIPENRRVDRVPAQTGGAEIWFELPSDEDASQQRAG
jgi:hypothetical protein